MSAKLHVSSCGMATIVIHGMHLQDALERERANVQAAFTQNFRLAAA